LVFMILILRGIPEFSSAPATGKHAAHAGCRSRRLTDISSAQYQVFPKHPVNVRKYR
jgi:hypothetical protein